MPVKPGTSPDMRERLPAGHPVWLVIEAVRLLDTSAFHARRRTGRAGHLEGETLRERTG